MPATTRSDGGAAALGGGSATVGVQPQKLLDEMVANTRRLDGILHDLCSSKPLSDNQQDTAPTSLVEKCSKPATESFDALREMLKGSKDLATRVIISDGDSLLGDHGDDEVSIDDSRWSHFSSTTKLVFASPSSASTGITPTSGISRDQLASALYQELGASDHLLPIPFGKALAHRGLRHLETHEKFLERGILLALGIEPTCNKPLREKAKASNQDESTTWWVESGRECQVSIKECEHADNWGILLLVEVESRLASGAIEANNNIPIERGERDKDLSTITARTRHEVFLPKSCYSTANTDSIGELIVSICVLELRLGTGQNKKAPTSFTTANTFNAKSKERKQSYVAEELSSSRNLHDRALPDTLEVLVSGSLIRDSTQSSSDDVTAEDCWLPSNPFVRFDIPSTLARQNRIVQAACGRLHSLFLNDLGMVFACGDATHGAVGLSTVKRLAADYVNTPTLVEFFVEKLLIVAQVACGGDVFTGAHSAAITTDGDLYTWGAGVGLGVRSLRSVSEPQLVHFPDELQKKVKIKSVACGCGFAVAISRDEMAAYSWGKWSEGRLGLGRIPVLEKNSRRHGGYKQLQAFQLSPKRLALPIQNVADHKIGHGSLNNDPPVFTKVVCGDAHCVAITADGQLVSWGRGGSGQLGVGSVDDMLAPTAVILPSPGLQWADVAAGGDWSMALDADGHIWTWGACGSGALGRNNISSVTDSSTLASTLLLNQKQLDGREHRRRAEAGLSAGGMSNMGVPRFSWMTPQLVPAFSANDIKITSISAGVRHGVALTRSGILFAWGDRTETPILVSHNPKASVEYAACGGHSIIALSSNGGSLSKDFRQLYKQCMRLSSLLETNLPGKDINTEALAGADVALIVSGRRLLAHKFILAQRSSALRQLLLDQLLFADGTSVRSTSAFPVPEVLVPSLRVDVARVVLEFIYTNSVSLPSLLLHQRDTVKGSHDSIYLARDIVRAARELSLRGLERMCHLQLLPLVSLARLPADHADKLEGNKAERERDDSWTLSESLKDAYRNPSWSDMTVVAEGRAIAVHRCVLEARSIFFRQLLSGSNKTDTIHVEDTYRGMVRVLDFIYSDEVSHSTLVSVENGVGGSEKADENRPPREANHLETEDPVGEDNLTQLLEDLKSANRYDLERMKREIERAVAITTMNCWRVLASADEAHASQLKLAAMTFAIRNLPDVVLHEKIVQDMKNNYLTFEAFSAQYPSLVEELFAQLRDADYQQRLLVEWKASLTKRVVEEQEAEEREWADKRANARFPWLALTFSVTFGALFLALMNVQEFRYHPAVPAINLLAVAVLAASVAFGWLERI